MFLAMILEDDRISQRKFEYIFNSYGKQMLYVAKGVVGNIQDAEDAVQDALLRIASNLDSVDTEQPIKARNYVLIAAKNAAINILRKRESSPETVDIESDQYPGEKDAESEVADRSSFETIVGCIEELDERYRPVLYLRLVEEMSEKQIASVLGRKYGTVKMQFKRGRAQLIKILKEKGVIPDGSM